MYIFIERDIYTCYVLLVIQLTAEFGGCVPCSQHGDLGDCALHNHRSSEQPVDLPKHQSLVKASTEERTCYPTDQLTGLFFRDRVQAFFSQETDG